MKKQRGAAEPTSRRVGVFLDRDDTLVVNRAVTGHLPHAGDLFDPDLVRLLPGVAAGLGKLAAAGFALVVVTNQGGVARGVCSIEQVEATNHQMRRLVRLEGGPAIDLILSCPYHPRGTAAPWNVEHHWRKPQGGMIRAAAELLRLDLGRSWMVGDAPRDIEAALGAGIPATRTILLGQAVDDFAGAVDRIVSGAGQETARA